MGIDRHFTVSTYIVNGDKVLLHLHKKYKIILPIGGHIESNELPEDACIREAKEEAGLDIKLYNFQSESKLKNSNDLTCEKILINPVHTLLCEVNSEHYHIDLVFFAVSESSEVKPDEGESEEIKWYSKEELEELKNVPQNVKIMANEALEIFK
ncbi:NUDIX hydrolase [Clostridium hydrogenum]|uniref:NUDIX hydrolase n=1 Tax=Clostridium hydrogenum TaxID=2855764 RepID=UPI001F159D63|nr:NUDIX domain-containing protein [Clostridium hydrogenum]